jgi:hypothetical protein
LGADGFLLYDSTYRVLICRPCQYAIQKSAVESHLLRHKIYRSDRQQLLNEIASFDLLEPEDVQSPPLGAPPVQGLPTIPGLRCNIPDCGELFASSKRMKRHWSEAHKDNVPGTAYARDAVLQTFFRGTKIRYFEVSSANVCEAPQPKEPHGRQSASEPDQACRHLDLETLGYFHHFTIATSQTLPTVQCNSVNYWQREVAKAALQHEWLMNGLLAVASYHMLWLVNEPFTQSARYSDNAAFRASFVGGFTALDKSIDDRLAVIKLGAQITCILRCAALIHNWPGSGLEDITSLESTTLSGIMSVLQGCGDVDLAVSLVHPSRPPNTPDHSPMDGIWATASAMIQKTTPGPVVVQILRGLPFRMASVFGRPDGTQDVLTVFSAIDGLIDCCYLRHSVSGEGAVAQWTCLVLWLHRLPMRFREMLDEGSPAALVVTGYWSMMVSEAEVSCWFISGLGARVLGMVKSQLPDDTKIHGLLQTAGNAMPGIL